MNEPEAIKPINIFDDVDLTAMPEVVLDEDTNTWFLKGEDEDEDNTRVLFTGCGVYTAEHMFDEDKIVWCLNGRLHRLDGPAIEKPDGTNIWFINDRDITREVEEFMADGMIPRDCDTWTEAHKVMFKLRFFGVQ